MLRANHLKSQTANTRRRVMLIGVGLLLVLATLPLPAWAGDFPGKGSRTKWDAAMKYSTTGIQQARKGNFELAKSSFEEAISIYNQDPAFYFNLGLIYERMKQADQAEIRYKYALKIDPKYSNAWFNLGALYGNQEKFTDSIHAYKQAKTCSLNDSDARAIDSALEKLESKLASSRGKDFYEKAKYEEALTNLDRAVALDNKNGQAYYLRGKVYEKLGKTSNAQSDFARSKELDYKPKQGE